MFYIDIQKMTESFEETYYQKSREVILNRAQDYYENKIIMKMINKD